MKARVITFLMLMAFAITLAVIVGQRLSERAMTVAVGVVAGVAASIPTSVFMSWMMSRMWIQRATPSDSAPVERPYESRQAPPSWPYPSTLAGGGYPTLAALPYPTPSAPGYIVQPPPMPRSFQVIGGADVSLEPGSTPPEEAWPR